MFQHVFVMPSSSARFTQLPRAIDKAPFYVALRKFRDFLRGRGPEPHISEISFPDLNLRVVPREERLKEEEQQKAAALQHQQMLGMNGMPAECNMAMLARASRPRCDRKKKCDPGHPMFGDLANGGMQIKTEKSDCYPSPYGMMPHIKAEKDHMNPGNCAGNGGQSFDFAAASTMATPKEFNFKSMFADGNTLIKQENPSDLAQYGFGQAMNGAWPGCPGNGMFGSPGGSPWGMVDGRGTADIKPDLAGLSPVDLSNGHTPGGYPFPPTSSAGMFMPPPPPGASFPPVSQYSSSQHPVPYPAFSQGYTPSFNPALAFPGAPSATDFPPYPPTAHMSPASSLFPNTFGPRPPNSN